MAGGVAEGWQVTVFVVSVMVQVNVTTFDVVSATWPSAAMSITLLGLNSMHQRMRNINYQCFFG